MSFLKTATEGGQIWAHRMRMTRQVIRFALLASSLIFLAYFTYQMSRTAEVSEAKKSVAKSKEFRELVEEYILTRKS